MTPDPSSLPAPASGSSPVSPAPASAAGGGRVVIVTGLSGAGKTVALKGLEDLGWEAVDNLPLSLLGALVRSESDRVRPLAVGIDIRTRDFGVEPVLDTVERLMAEGGGRVDLLFLDCGDETLCRRYTESRRRHPLAADRPLQDGIRHERALLQPLRARADLVIDTTELSPAALRHLLAGAFTREDEQRGLVVFVTSFAYRNGLPREADLVFDARFLANPHYRPELRPLTGRDQAVADYVTADPAFAPFLEALTGLLAPLLPRFAAEGKSYLTIAIGCTGGRHRSVAVAEQVAAWVRRQGKRVDLRHRELEEGAG